MSDEQNGFQVSKEMFIRAQGDSEVVKQLGELVDRVEDFCSLGWMTDDIVKTCLCLSNGNYVGVNDAIWDFLSCLEKHWGEYAWCGNEHISMAWMTQVRRLFTTIRRVALSE